METVTDFIFLGSKITADGDCSHEIKRCLLLGRKAMTNLDSIVKSRDITSLKRSKINNQPISKWISLAREIAGEKVEAVTDFIFLGSKINADGDLCHEIKTLAPW